MKEIKKEILALLMYNRLHRDLPARNLDIFFSRKKGVTYAVLAEKHSLSTTRIKQIQKKVCGKIRCTPEDRFNLHKHINISSIK